MEDNAEDRAGAAVLSAHRPGTTTQGVALLTLGQGAIVAFGYAVHILGSRVLSQEDYGRFMVVLSASSWIHIALISLILPGMSKIVSENPARLRVALATAAKWHWGLAGVGAAVLLAVSPLVARSWGDSALAPMLMVVAVEMPFFAAFTMGRYLLTALRHYAAASVGLIAYAVVRAAGACALILLGIGAIGGTIGLAAGSVVGGAIGMSYVLALRRRLPAEPYPPMVRRSLAWAAVTLPAGMGVATLVTLDMWLVKALVNDPAAAGIYGVAFAVSRFPDVMVQGLLGALFAKVSSALAEGKAAVARSVSVEAMRFVLRVFVPVCALTACSSHAIIHFLFTSKYDSAAPILTILVAAISCAAAFKVMLQLLSAADRPGPRLIFVVALLPTSLGLNVLLIRHYGLIGAAVASLVTMVAGLIVSGIFVHRFLGVRPPAGSALRCGLAGAVSYGLGLLWMASGWLVIAKLALLGIVYMCLLLLLRELGVKDFRAFGRSMFRSRLAGAEAK